MVIFGPKPWVNPLGIMSILQLFFLGNIKVTPVTFGKRPKMSAISRKFAEKKCAHDNPDR